MVGGVGDTLRVSMTKELDDGTEAMPGGRQQTVGTMAALNGQQERVLDGDTSRLWKRWTGESCGGAAS